MNFEINIFKVTTLIIGALFFFIYITFIGLDAFRGGLLTLTIYFVIAIFTFPFVADTMSDKLQTMYFLRSIIYIVLYVFAPFLFIYLIIFNTKGANHNGR